jgi:hypothetical protein
MAVRIPIISDFDGKGLDKALQQFSKLETTGERVGFAMNKAFLPAVAALGALSVAAGVSIKAAVEDDAAQAQLALSLQNVTGATDEQIAAVEKQIGAMQMATGVADDELRPAFATLVVGTKDIAEANKALALAMDVSAATGTDLATVSDALAKAYGGNTRAIGALSPEIKKMIKDGATLSEVQDVLNKNFGGAAATAAGTAQGQFKRLGVALDEVKESIGRALLPAVEAVLPALISFGNWAADHVEVLMAVGFAIGAVATGIVAYKVATMALKAVQIVAIALNWEMAASAAAANTALTVGVGAAAIAAGLVAIAGAFLIYKQHTQAATASTQQATAALSLHDKQVAQVQMDNKGLTETLKKVDEKQKDVAKSAGSATDKAKQMSDAIKEAADALQNYMVKALSDAQDALKEAEGKFGDFASTVSKGIKDAFSFKDAKDAGDETGSGFLAGLRSQVTGIKQYGTDVDALLKRGLSQDALKAVLEAGGESGAAIAHELVLGAQENITGPDGVNALVDSANQVAQQIGLNAADMWYGAGVTSAQAYLKGVEEAFAIAQAKLGAKGLRLPDIKGIGASFSDAITAPTAPIAPTMPDTNWTGPGSGQTFNVTVNGGLDSSSAIGQNVVNALRAFNRTNGPAQFQVA